MRMEDHPALISRHRWNDWFCHGPELTHCRVAFSSYSALTIRQRQADAGRSARAWQHLAKPGFLRHAWPGRGGLRKAGNG